MKRFSGRFLVVLVCLVLLAAGSCGGGGGGEEEVAVWVQNADNSDLGGGADGVVWGGNPGAYNIVALDYQRIDVAGPAVNVPLPAPGFLDENAFVFAGALAPGVYQFTATYSSGTEIDQELYGGSPPKASTDTALVSYGSASDTVDLTGLSGAVVTLVIQCTL